MFGVHLNNLYILHACHLLSFVPYISYLATHIYNSKVLARMNIFVWGGDLNTLGLFDVV